MKMRHTYVLAGLLLAVSLPASGAMYKWVDEHGTRHYGDTVPPKYASRAVDRSGRSPASNPKGGLATAALDAAAASPDAQQEAKRQLEQKRQDHALLATYANEDEIELARARELKRNQETVQVASAGLAGSTSPEDRRKLDSLLDLSRRETDRINAKFDAHKARYRELRSGASQAASVSLPAPSK